MKRLLVLLTACASGPTSTVAPALVPASMPASAPAVQEDDASFCVSETNRYRLLAGKAPVSQNDELAQFAAEGAKVDGLAHQAHRHFSTTTFRGRYVKLGENELPWWSKARHGSVRELVRAGLKMMIDEGPGGAHHDNIVGDFTDLGCGIFVNGDEVTVVQNFKR